MNPFSKLRENTFLYLSILLGISVISHFPFVLTGFGEPDSARIAAVVIDRISHGSGGPLANIYFTDTIPLYVLYLSLFMKLLNFNYSYLPAIMNYTNAVFATLTIIPAYFFIKRLFENAAVAFCSVLLLIFAPTFYQSSIYGFPHLIALFFFFTSLYFYLVWLDSKYTRVRYIMLIFSVLTLIVTLLLKTPLVLASGIYLGILYLKKISDRKKISVSIFSLILAFGGFFLIRWQITGTSGGSTSSVSEALNFLSYQLVTKPTLGYLIRQIKPAILGTGVLTSLLGIISFVYYVYRKRLDILVFIMSWAAISNLFWLFISGNNARYFAVSILPLTAVIVMFFHEKGPRLTIIFTGILILGNFLITSPSYSTDFPSGNLYKSGVLLENITNLYHSKAKVIANLNEDKIAVIGYYHNPYVIYEIIRSAPSYEAKKIGREDYMITVGNKKYIFCYIDYKDVENGINEALIKYQLNDYVFVSVAYDLARLQNRGFRIKDLGILPSFQGDVSIKKIISLPFLQ